MNSILEELRSLLIRSQKSAQIELLHRDALDAYINKIDSNAEILIWREKGSIQGFIAFYSNEPKGQVAFLTMLAVDPGYARKGIGRCLLQAAISFVRAKSFSKFKLEVNANNYAARALYDQSGFVNVGGDAENIRMELIL